MSRTRMKQMRKKPMIPAWQLYLDRVIFTVLDGLSYAWVALVALALLALIFFCGCSPWQNKVKRETVQIVQTEKQDFKGNHTVTYPSPTKQDLNLSASGNATISVNIPAVEPKLTRLSNKTEGSVESDMSFSFDSYIKSVSLGGWVAIMLAFCAVLYFIVYFINKTMVGKALDSAAGASINATRSIIGELEGKMMHMDPTSAGWNEFNAMKNLRACELQNLLEKKR